MLMEITLKWKDYRFTLKAELLLPNSDAIQNNTIIELSCAPHYYKCKGNSVFANSNWWRWLLNKDIQNSRSIWYIRQSQLEKRQKTQPAYYYPGNKMVKYDAKLVINEQSSR